MSIDTTTATPSNKPKAPKAKAKSAKAAATKATTKPKKPSKSPVAYPEALATEICVRTAEGQSLRTIASAEGMPSLRCLTLWQQQHKDFAVALDRAREARADMRIEEIADVTAQIRSGQLDPHA